ASEQNSRLAGDLSEHRRAHMTFAPGARDQLPELVDAGLLAIDPIVHRRIELGTAAPRQEVDPKLLEIARQACGQQSFPLIGWNEAGNLLLRPVEAERFAKASVGASDLELIDLAPGGERSDSEHAIELIETHQAADDV